MNMVYALRQYLKGVRGSGTKDLWVGDYIPTRDEISANFDSVGKYVVMERGKGIRGMRKVAEYIFNEPSKHMASEWMPKVFASETESSMSVKKEIQLRDLSDEDLDGLWDSMLETPVESDDDFQRFVADNSKIKKEMYRRLKEKPEHSQEHSAESDAETNVSVSKGFGYGTIVTAGAVGLVAGALMQEIRWKKRFEAAENKMQQLEDLIDGLTKKAEQANNTKTFNSPQSLSNHDILRSFNARNGY